MKSQRARIDNSYSVPYLAGRNSSGTAIYIDKSLPRYMQVDGRRVDVWACIELHETVEFAMMECLGLLYPKAHELATLLENGHVTQLGVSASAYEKAVKPYIQAADKAVRSGGARDLPPDLDEQPYADSKDLHIVAILQKVKATHEGGDNQ